GDVEEVPANRMQALEEIEKTAKKPAIVKLVAEVVEVPVAALEVARVAVEAREVGRGGARAHVDEAAAATAHDREALLLGDEIARAATAQIAVDPLEPHRGPSLSHP